MNKAEQTPPPRDDARLREHLANERTLLSWIRLGLATAAFGFVVARLSLFLEASGGTSRDSSGRVGEFLGVGLVLLGTVVVVFAALRFFHTETEIEQRAYTRRYGLVWSVIVAAVLVGLTLSAFLLLT